MANSVRFHVATNGSFGLASIQIRRLEEPGRLQLGMFRYISRLMQQAGHFQTSQRNVSQLVYTLKLRIMHEMVHSILGVVTSLYSNDAIHSKNVLLH